MNNPVGNHLAADSRSTDLLDDHAEGSSDRYTDTRPILDSVSLHVADETRQLLEEHCPKIGLLKILALIYTSRF